MNRLRRTSRDARQYHGLGGTPTYRTWYSMIERCGNPASASWPHYGGKGITVCERWLELQNFVADMGLRPEGRTLDRIDREKNYGPDNCRWATELEQQRGRGNVKCSEQMAASIRDAASSGVSQSEIADAAGMSPSNVSRIVGRRTWK